MADERVILRTAKRSILIDGPFSYYDMSTEKYQRLMRDWLDQNDTVKLYSILFDLDYDLLYRSNDQVLVGPLSAYASFVFEDTLRKAKVPEFITINEQAYRVPKKLGAMSFGQAVQLRNKVAELTNNGELPMESCVSWACAVYFQPQIDGTLFDMDRAEELEPLFRALPIMTTGPVGFFYLRKLTSYGSILRNLWHLVRTTKTRSIVKLLNLRGWKSLHHTQI